MEGDEKIRVFLRMRPTTSRISHISKKYYEKIDKIFENF